MTARRPRPRRRLASRTRRCSRARPAADRARRGRVPVHGGRPAAARRHLVVVGQHPRPLASASERGARGAGPHARARRVRRLHARAGRGARRAAGWRAAARADARVLFRQRIDGRRSRDEAGAASTGASATGQSAGRSSTLHHAYHGDTVGAMSASEDSVFTRPFALDAVRRGPRHAPYCYRCPVGLERATCHIECLDASAASRSLAGSPRRRLAWRRCSSSRCCRARAA